MSFIDIIHVILAQRHQVEKICWIDDRKLAGMLTYRLHETQGTLDSTDLDMDGILNLYDLGVVITHRIAKLSRHPSK